MIGNLIASPGFWRGMVYFITAAGITLDPGQENAIIAAGLAISGLIHAFVATRPKP